MPTNNYENRSVVVRVPDFGIARGQDGLSAYEQAVAGGYEGTEAQFNQELSSFKTLHDETETAATAAAESATSAGQSATAAAGSAESAATSASSSATSAADASASAGSAADSASNAASSAASAAASAASAGNSASTAAQKASEASASATAASSSETNAASSEDAAADSAAAAAASAAAIEEYEHDAEAWAIGKRGGTEVPSTDETYHNNSKYYAGQAGTSASTAASSAAAASTSENNSASSASSAAASASSASTSAATATEKAGEASTSASAASTSAASAAGSATNAASSATAASASATAAGNAQTAAETAQGKAEDAQEAAEQAQSDAEAAAQSVSQSAAQISQNASDISDLKSASDEVLEILKHPISYSKSDVSMSEYFTTIIDGVQLIAGTRYDISATLASAATQAYYLLLYKGETSVTSITIESGSTTGTFYYDVTETGDDYSVKVASGAYAAHVGVSATVVPKTNGSILDDIEAKVADTVKPDNIISDVLYANFAYGGTTLAENNDCLICYFPVVNGSVYTIDRGEPLRDSRIGYCTSIPYIGCTITGYAGLYGESVKTIQATADGYCCVLMRWSGDTVTVQQVLDMAYIYSGAYDPNIGKTTKHLDDISYMDKHDDSFIVSSNLFDGFYVAEKYLTNAGVEWSSASYGYTKNMIPVYPGYRLTANSGNGSRMIRYVTAYDKNGNVLADKGYSGELYTGFIVPDGVYYVRISTVMTALTAEDFRINNSGTPVDYDAYSVKPNNIGDMTRLNREPLTVLPDYFVNTMSYRPVGSLSKGYICMVTDDGTSGLATYTIPLAISKNVPFTFGVMHDSEVFADETMTATVVDAVNNHGCSVAQHGSVLWDVMSEKDLVNFFNNEKAFLAGKGLVAEGAIIPQHRTNNLVKAVAGGLYGVVRSGYDGKGEGQGGDVDNYSITNYYDYYTSGERSSIYGLSSYNCAFATKAYNHSAIDYAYANNKILIVYYHEFDIGDEQKEVIEDMIDYAKDKGITFTTLGNIRYIR